MRKLLQNSLFAAMTAWALYGVQSHLEAAPVSSLSVSHFASVQP
jgi:hypothetical protein